MKFKFLLFFFILMTSSFLFSENKREESQIEPESLTPSSAICFLKIHNISKCLEFINSYDAKGNLAKLLLKKSPVIQRLNEKTGIDILNIKQLKDSGIDTGKSLSSALIPGETTDNIILFIPVTDKKVFTANIEKVLTHLKEEKTAKDAQSINYKNHKIFPIEKYFLCIVDSYFIITNTEKNLKTVIDLELKDINESIASDPFFKDYKSALNSTIDTDLINIYFNKQFIKRISTGFLKPYNNLERNGKKIDTSAENETKENISLKKTLPEYNIIKYLSVSIASIINELSIKCIISINENELYGKTVLEAINTGLFDKALFIDNPAGYHFLSLDINAVYNFLKMYQPNDHYLKKIISNDKIIKKMVLPCSKSFVNIIIKKTANSGEVDNFVAYIPMKDCGKISNTFDRLKNMARRKYSEDGTFGEEKILENESFWIKNSNTDIFYILNHAGDFYVCNNKEMMVQILNYPAKKSFNINNNFIQKADSNTFLLSYIQLTDESFIKAIIMMLLMNQNPELNTIINNIESINLIGKKFENNVILDLSLKMNSAK